MSKEASKLKVNNWGMEKEAAGDSVNLRPRAKPDRSRASQQQGQGWMRVSGDLIRPTVCQVSVQFNEPL